MSFIIRENETKTYYIVNIILMIIILVVLLYAIYDGSFIRHEVITNYVCNGIVFNSSDFSSLLNFT